MASEIDISNLALSHVGGRPIESFSEGTKEAIECRRFYETDRNAVLEDHNWNFARKSIDLALLSETFPGWDYAYAWPTDCLGPRIIYNPVGLPGQQGVVEIQYEVRANEALTQRIILTDQEDAVLIYTAKVTTANLYDNQFIQALALRLGADLAQTIRADSQLKLNLLTEYGAIIARAKVKQSNEGYIPDDNEGSFVEARV